ncbi:hypothetical protein FBU59_005525 [Linderina macrospora]|uniref:Uncharacterized protein n=1 Tax=Linderina macrospora TaxID=4868 RepID=A0ACC1J2E3_9FUNG|nr:hypothetical protein FBU59_005525 [Linderina macrospora]
MQGALSPFSESVYQTAPPLAPTMSATPQQPQRMARGSTFASHVRSQSAAVPSPLIRGLSTPISRTSTSPAIGGNDQSLAQAIDGFSQALGGNNSSSVPVAAKTPPTAAEKPASAHKRSRSVHALMGLFTRKQSVAAVAPAISNTDPSMSEPPQFTLPLATPAPAPSAPPRLSREPSSIGSVHSGSIATPKNSLPLPRPALTTRMVSELNYPTRRTVTASVAPYLLPPRADPNGDQLIANYQRFAVEAQSRFAADECTDYSQTPMLNVFGVLDRGIQDYVHPGLVGELPTLWLPNKDLNESSAGDVLGDKQEVEREVERDQAMVEPEFAESAPQWVVNRLLSYRMNPTPGASAGEAQFYPSAADHDEELREVRIHQG